MITGNTPVIDVTGDQPVEHRGEVPAGAIVVPGSRPTSRPATRAAAGLIIGYRTEATETKVQLNEMLREFGSSVGS